MAHQRQNLVAIHSRHTSAVKNSYQGMKPRTTKWSNPIEVESKRKLYSNGTTSYSTSSVAPLETTPADRLSGCPASTENGLSADARSKQTRIKGERTRLMETKMGTKSRFSRSTPATNKS